MIPACLNEIIARRGVYGLNDEGRGGVSSFFAGKVHGSWSRLEREHGCRSKRRQERWKRGGKMYVCVFKQGQGVRPTVRCGWRVGSNDGKGSDKAGATMRRERSGEHSEVEKRGDDEVRTVR
jgi:hypothetical protein